MRAVVSGGAMRVDEIPRQRRARHAPMLQTKVPGMGFASTHSPAAFLTFGVGRMGGVKSSSSTGGPIPCQGTRQTGAGLCILRQAAHDMAWALAAPLQGWCGMRERRDRRAAPATR